MPINIEGGLLVDSKNVVTEVETLHWADLKALRDASQLVSGKQYRITDYVTTAVQEGTSSAGHQFDLIVTADTNNSLNEEAKACLHTGDTYFANTNFAKWKVWYCLDNDTNRFAWADQTNGKGVIYRLIDEFGNDCPYDFKNIMFDFDNYTATRLETTDSSSAMYYRSNQNDKVGENENLYCWASSAYPVTLLYTKTDRPTEESLFYNEDGTQSEISITKVYGSGFVGHIYTFSITTDMSYDASLNGDKTLCYNNVMYPLINASNIMEIGMNYFRTTNAVLDCNNITIKNNCYEITFKGGCNNIIVENNCHNINFGQNILDSKIKEDCCYIDFGDTSDSSSGGNSGGSGGSGGSDPDEEEAGTLEPYHYSKPTYVAKYLSTVQGTMGESIQNPLVITNIYKSSEHAELIINATYGNTVQEIAYADLKDLKQRSKLIPEKEYRIIDYETVYEHSYGLRFDVVVKASSKNTLYEEARLMKSEHRVKEDKTIYLVTFTDSSEPEEYYMVKRGLNGYLFIKVSNGRYYKEVHESKITIDGTNITVDDTQPTQGPSYMGSETPMLEYFINSNSNYLEMMKIKYDIENNSNKYEWANTSNGKGVIYWMQDSYGNEAPYDFINIMFRTTDFRKVKIALNADGTSSCTATGTLQSTNYRAQDDNAYLYRIEKGGIIWFDSKPDDNYIFTKKHYASDITMDEKFYLSTGAQNDVARVLSIERSEKIEDFDIYIPTFCDASTTVGGTNTWYDVNTCILENMVIDNMRFRNTIIGERKDGSKLILPNIVFFAYGNYDTYKDLKFENCSNLFFDLRRYGASSLNYNTFKNCHNLVFKKTKQTMNNTFEDWGFSNTGSSSVDEVLKWDTLGYVHIENCNIKGVVFLDSELLDSNIQSNYGVHLKQGKNINITNSNYIYLPIKTRNLTMDSCNYITFETSNDTDPTDYLQNIKISEVSGSSSSNKKTITATRGESFVTEYVDATKVTVQV